MNRAVRLVLLALGLSAVGCGQPATELSQAHADAIRDSVRTASAQLRRLSANAQWDSLGAMYSEAPGFRFLENGSVQYESAGAVRVALEQLPPGVSLTTTYSDIEVDPVRPGVAAMSALFETTLQDSGGPQFSYGGAVTVLWVHEPDGWRIRAGHSSNPVSRNQ